MPFRVGQSQRLRAGIVFIGMARNVSVRLTPVKASTRAPVESAPCPDSTGALRGDPRLRRISKRNASGLKRLPISPMTLTCPRYKVKRGKECMNTAGGFVAIHIERIQMAALSDQMGLLRDKAKRRALRAEHP
jgi:hypothetical protein